MADKSLKILLEHLDSGELVLPEIQRDFVWDKKNGISKIDEGLRTDGTAFMKFPLEKIIIFDEATGTRM